MYTRLNRSQFEEVNTSSAGNHHRNHFSFPSLYQLCLSILSACVDKKTDVYKLSLPRTIQTDLTFYIECNRLYLWESWLNKLSNESLANYEIEIDNSVFDFNFRFSNFAYQLLLDRPLDFLLRLEDCIGTSIHVVIIRYIFQNNANRAKFCSNCARTIRSHEPMSVYIYTHHTILSLNMLSDFIRNKDNWCSNCIRTPLFVINNRSDCSYAFEDHGSESSSDSTSNTSSSSDLEEKSTYHSYTFAFNTHKRKRF